MVRSQSTATRELLFPSNAAEAQASRPDRDAARVGHQEEAVRKGRLGRLLFISILEIYGVPRLKALADCKTLGHNITLAR